MKNLKKVLAFALAFVMVLGVVLPAVHAKEVTGAEKVTDEEVVTRQAVLTDSKKTKEDIFKQLDLVPAKKTKEDIFKQIDLVPAKETGKVVKMTFKFEGVDKEVVVKEVKEADFDFSKDKLFAVDGYKLTNPEALKGKTPEKDDEIVLKYVKKEIPLVKLEESIKKEIPLVKLEESIKKEIPLTEIEDPSKDKNTDYITSGDGQKIAIDEIAKVGQNATALPLIIYNNSSVPVTVEVHNSKHQIQGVPYVIPAGGKAVTEPFAIGTKLYVVPTNPDANIWKDIATKTVTIKKPQQMAVYRKDANGKFEKFGYKYINTNSVAFQYVRLGLNEENPVKDVNKTNKVQGKAPVKVAKGKASGNNPSTGDPSMIGYVVTTVVAAAAAFATKKNYK